MMAPPGATAGEMSLILEPFVHAQHRPGIPYTR
jgi:hypothetical protein